MRKRDDRGTISMFTVLMTLVVFGLAGLIVDGGLAIHAREHAYDIAEQGARAAANQIDEDRLRQTGEVDLVADPCPAAYALLAKYGGAITSSGCARLSDQEVQVTVHIDVRLQLLSIVPGVGTFTMQAAATAHPTVGN